MDAIHEAYDQPLAAARAHKARGGKVVGFVSTAVPTELIAASGAFSVLVRGDVHRGTTFADAWMEEQFDPMARSIFDMALAGELQFLDLLIIPREADSFMRLYLYLREVERLKLSNRIPKLWQFDFLQSAFSTSDEYNLARMNELREELHRVTGQSIDDGALRDAIDEANANRAKCRDMLALRNRGLLRGSELLRVIGARYALPLDEHTRRLAGIAADRQNRKPDMPILVAGNAHDNTLFYEYLEEQGFSIVGDYHWLGDACCAHDVTTRSRPLEALTAHYRRHSMTSRRYPQTPRELVDLAKSAGAKGVAFYLFAAEEALSWDVPNQSRSLEEAGIATLVLDDQPYGPRLDAELQSRIDAFRAKVSA